MLLIECEQGSAEWLQARCGVITASRFRDACERLAETPEKVDKKTGEVRPAQRGRPSAKSTGYAAQIAVERISGDASEENFVSWQMRRGTELEPQARLAYEATSGQVVLEAGVVLTDDLVFGYSTDGFIGDDGFIEIKCVASAEKLIGMWRDHDLSEYRHQIQGGLWLTGRKWCDFVMYAPQLAKVGKELFIQRIGRDEDFIAKMELDLLDFALRVTENERVLRMPLAA